MENGTSYLRTDGQEQAREIFSIIFAVSVRHGLETN